MHIFGQTAELNEQYKLSIIQGKEKDNIVPGTYSNYRFNFTSGNQCRIIWR